MLSLKLSPKTNRVEWGAAVYPWLVWLIASAFLFYKYVLQVAPSVMVTSLMQQFHLNARQLGHFAAFYFYAYMLMQFPSGMLLDRCNIRRLLPGAICTCALGSLLMAKAHVLYLAEIGRFLIGVGGSFSALGAMKLITLYFPANRFALASSLMMTLGMLGAVGGQAPLAHLIDHVGAEQGLVICAIAGLALAVLTRLVLKDTLSPLPSVAALKAKPKVRDILRRPQSWLIAIYSGLAFLPISAFSGLWGVPFVSLKMGVSNIHASELISLSMVGFAIGCPISGYLSEKNKQRRPLMAIGTTLGLISLLIIILVPIAKPVLLGALLFCFGFFTSFFFISFTVIKEINPIVLSGSAIGFINLFDALFGAMSEPGVGYLMDSSSLGQAFALSDYQYGLLLLPCSMALSLLVLCFVRESYPSDRAL